MEEILIKEFQDKGYKTFIGENSTKDFKKWTPKAGEKAFAAY